MLAAGRRGARRQGSALRDQQLRRPRPCGSPDGTWDDVTTYRWQDLANGGAIVRIDGGCEREYDARGRLIRQTPPGPSIRTTDVREVEHEYRGALLAVTRTNAFTVTFSYDAAGRVNETRTVSANDLRRAQARGNTTHGGNVTRLGTGELAIDHANTYRDGRLVSVRTSSRNMRPPVIEATREHDAHGLLVRRN